MRWEEFRSAAGELATQGERLFDETGLCLVATLRKDGSPRISPVEPYIVDGQLLLGMMWRSRKALDLLSDARLAVHSAQCDREATGGDFKLYGRAFDVGDDAMRTAYGDATEARIDWRPTGPFHLFAVDIDSAAYITFGDKPIAMRWSTAGGFTRIRHPDD